MFSVMNKLIVELEYLFEGRHGYRRIFNQGERELFMVVDRDDRLRERSRLPERLFKPNSSLLAVLQVGASKMSFCEVEL